jgi:hypothetical protein
MRIVFHVQRDWNGICMDPRRVAMFFIPVARSVDNTWRGGTAQQERVIQPVKSAKACSSALACEQQARAR